MSDSNQNSTFSRISAPQPAAPKHAIPAHMSKKPEKPSHGKRAAIAAGLGLGAIALAYAGGVAAFSNIYYPNTHIAGVEVSLMNRDAAISRVESSAQSYTLSIHGKDFAFKFKPEDGALPVDIQSRADQIISENDPLAWPIHVFESIARDGNARGFSTNEEPQLSPDFDEAEFERQLIAAIEEHNANRSGQFNAPSAYDEKTGTFTLEKARANVKLKAAPVLDKARRALSGLVSDVELEDEDFEKLAGSATDAQLEKACRDANALIGTDISLKMGDAQAAKLDGKLLASWISFDTELRPTLDMNAVRTWVDELDNELDTAGSERSYTRPDGKVVTVQGGGYGWIVNSSELANLVVNAVETKRTGEIEVPLKQSAQRFTAHGERDWNEWIDIDLKEQHVRYYDSNDALIWESGCITGNPNTGNATPTGVFSMNQMSRNITLIGKKDPETNEPEYRTPVSYWMPFVGGAIGLHDASWQAASSFSNPTAYTWTGSHGCVNLPPDKAAELYGMVKPGLVVIVHW